MSAAHGIHVRVARVSANADKGPAPSRASYLLLVSCAIGTIQAEFMEISTYLTDVGVFSGSNGTTAPMLQQYNGSALN
ncbi:hypothetical protein EV715DRAFT_298323 [Schizophyllum commune]